MTPDFSGTGNWRWTSIDGWKPVLSSARNQASNPDYFPPSPTEMALNLIRAERWAQHEKWGEQNHPDGTGSEWRDDLANKMRRLVQERFANGEGTWLHILFEEVYEAAAETDDDKLIRELTQVGAVCAAWIEAIQRRRQK